MSFLRGIARGVARGVGRNLGRGLLRGVKRVGGGILKGARKVTDVARKGLDVVDRLKNVPIIGDLVQKAEDAIPISGLIRGGVVAADQAVGAGEALARGDVKGAVSRGRGAIETGFQVRDEARSLARRR